MGSALSFSLRLFATATVSEETAEVTLTAVANKQ